MAQEISDELLEGYSNALRGISDPRPFNHGNINICFMQKFFHVYDIQGKTTYGKYLLPKTLADLGNVLRAFDEEVDSIEIGNTEYEGTLNPPEYTTVDGTKGTKNLEMTVTERREKELDIAEEKPFEGKEAELSVEEKKNIKSAMAYLQKRGYVVKKLIPSWKVVSMNHKGEPEISKVFYGSREEFEKVNPENRFIEFVKSLKKEEEEIIL